MLALAVVTAGALTAFLGAGTASATVLCKTNLTASCLGVWDWQAGTAIGTASEGKVQFLNLLGAVENECEGNINFATGTTGSATTTVTANIAAGGITWKNCDEATVTLKGGSLEIHHITGTDHGTITVSGWEITSVMRGTHCIYKTGNGLDLGTLTEGAPATIDVSAQLTSTTVGCSTPVYLVGSYELTTPTTTLGVAAS